LPGRAGNRVARCRSGGMDPVDLCRDQFLKSPEIPVIYSVFQK
jgi:hypothetical protein